MKESLEEELRIVEEKHQKMISKIGLTSDEFNKRLDNQEIESEKEIQQKTIELEYNLN